MAIRLGAIIAALAIFAGGAHAEECGPLNIINTVHMVAAGGELDAVPVLINGTQKQFLFDTGGFTTQIGRAVVKELNLPVRQGDFELYDMNGNISRDEATIVEFAIGRLRGKNTSFPVTFLGGDGILSLNYLRPYDIDVDFGTDTLNFISRDHCPGKVVYWQATAVAVLPITLRDGHITVPVTLDGHEFSAIIDTGATNTSLRMDIAQHTYGLIMGAPDTPEDGELNADASLKTYRHVFKQLVFGDITVSNPHISIFPDVMNRNGDHSEQTGTRAKQVRDDIVGPPLIIGMSMLRKLHIYFAFGEGKMYVSPASTAQPAITPTSLVPAQ